MAVIDNRTTRSINFINPYEEEIYKLKLKVNRLFSILRRRRKEPRETIVEKDGGVNIIDRDREIYTEKLFLSGSDFYLSGSNLNINNTQQFSPNGTNPIDVNLTSNGLNYFYQDVYSDDYYDYLNNGNIGFFVNNWFTSNIYEGFSGANVNFIFGTNHNLNFEENLILNTSEVNSFSNTLTILSGSKISNSNLTSTNSQIYLDNTDLSSTNINIVQIKRDIFDSSGAALRGLYIENFDKDQADTIGVWENNHFDETYAIYSAGGDVYFGNSELTNNNNIKLTKTGGIAIKLTAGEDLSGGNVITAMGDQPNKVIRCKLADGYPNGSDMPIGVVYADVLSGADCWIVVSGVAEVYNDGTSNVSGGYFLAVSQTMSGAAVAGEDPAVPATAEHWREVGHAIDTKIGAGLVKAVLHFN